MGIPLLQLETWSHQGSVTQSVNTYGTIRRALTADNANYFTRNFDVFLQGSYGNSTNIYADSDVDIIIRYDGAFFHDLSGLSATEQSRFSAAFSEGTYPYGTFKQHVREALEAAFGASVKPGKKALAVEAGGARRNADVLVAFEFRRYHKFNGVNDENFDKGIAFFTSDNTRIVNYPKQHAVNCTSKQGDTLGKFKPVIRIVKNMRNNLVDKGIIRPQLAPSYFVEGLLYNSPHQMFSGNYDTIIASLLNWLTNTSDRSKFVCANEQCYLLGNNSNIRWSVEDCGTFIRQLVWLWNNW
jgi:hypothetical protein